MSFPTTFSELNTLYKRVQGDLADLDSEWTELRYPRNDQHRRYWQLATSANTSVGSYSQAANGGKGGFVFNE